VRRLLPLLILAASGCQSVAPPCRLRAQQGVAAASPFLAGVGVVDFTPAPGTYPLGGFGGGERRVEFPFLLGLGWPGQLALYCHQQWHETGEGLEADMLARAEGIHDPLLAKALVLRPRDGAPVAIVRIDGIGTPRVFQERVAARAAELGYPEDRVLVSSTHTHSGVGAYFRDPLARLAGTDNFRPELEDRLVEACVVAIQRAHDAAVPATLGFGRARDRRQGLPVVARNRRADWFQDQVAPDAIDDEIGLLLVRDGASAAPLALLVNYGVHGTVLGMDNTLFSGDLPGAIERALEERLGAPVLFLNGAEGDAAPAHVEGASDHVRCTLLGERFARLVEPQLPAIATFERIQLASALAVQPLQDPRLVLTPFGRERFLDGDAGWLNAPLTWPINAALWALGLTNTRFSLSWTLGLAFEVDLSAYVSERETLLGGVRIIAGADDVALLTIPGEATHDVGLAVRQQAARHGATRSFVLGLCLDHIGYVASRREYRRGGYEAAFTFFGEHTATTLHAAREVVLKALGYGETARIP
jgi:hypothetical protein